MHSASKDTFDAAFAAFGGQSMPEVANCTDAQVIMQLSEVKLG
jgi:hypothetical protein